MEPPQNPGRFITDNFNNPKVQFAQKIKRLQSDLKRDDIRLESFLLSQTHRHDLRWPTPGELGKQATVHDYLQHHVLLTVDNPPHYVRELIAALA